MGLYRRCCRSNRQPELLMSTPNNRSCRFVVGQCCLFYFIFAMVFAIGRGNSKEDLLWMMGFSKEPDITTALEFFEALDPLWRNETYIASMIGSIVDKTEDQLYFNHNTENSTRITYDEMMATYPDFRTSPYELSNPKYKLPHWAKKRSRWGESLIPKGGHICFVHVGKAAGSTLGCALGFQLHCEIEKVRAGALPLYTTNVIHNGMDDCPRHMPFYLFSLRNPLNRVRSAYVYDRPKAAANRSKDDELYSGHGEDGLYTECPFWTLNDLAMKGLDPNKNNSNNTDGTGVSQLCKDRAVKTIRGLERHGYHLHYNYRWFVDETEVFDKSLSTSRILAIRSEHITQDWTSAQAVLQGKSTRVRNFAHRNPSAGKTEPSDTFLSETAIERLCYHLCPEIQWYKKLLYQAANLDFDDLVESLYELNRTCPEQVIAATCPPLEL